MNAMERDFFRDLIRDKRASLLEWFSEAGTGRAPAPAALLDDLEHALERLERESFGACTGCDGEVEKELLIAWPNTEICLECMGESQRRKLEGDLRMAQEVSRSLLPRRAPSNGFFDFGIYFRPSRILSGDFYDFMKEPRSEALRVAVGDVAGKGIPAGLLMSSLQATLRGLGRLGLAPAELLGRANQQFLESSHPGRFASVFYGVLRNDGSLSYASAGHNPPLLRRSAGRVEPLEATGHVLGIADSLTVEEVTCYLEPGDLLALYTDGVTEAEGSEGDLFGEERLAEALDRSAERPAQEIADRVAAAVEQFSPGEPGDDRTLVVCRRTAGSWT